MSFTNYIQQITASNGTVHDIVDSSASHFIKGTQTAATNVWTGPLPDGVTAYYDGLTIDYFLPYAGTSTGATLNLGGLGAKPVYYGNAVGAVTTHYPQYSVIHLTYIINSSMNSGNGCWKATGYYDSNSVSQLRFDYTTIYAGTAGIFPYTLIMMNTSGNYESIVTSSSTGTSKARNTAGFVPGTLLAYYASGTTTSGNKISANNYGVYEAYPGFDFRYSANISTSSLTVGKPVYLVGTITNGLFYLDSTWWTQTLPTSDDGKVYMYIGSTYNISSASTEYRVNLAPYHPMYWYKNGALRQYGNDAGTINGLTVQTAVPSGAVFTDTKNTTGSTDTSSKIFLIGATSQAANPQTYSHDTVYIGTDGCLYSNSTKVSVEGHTHSGYATSGHTHTLSLASSTGTSSITLDASTKYQLTAGGSTYIFTTPPNTTYSSKPAASGGTDVSLVTTGEKYTWNNKSNLTIGTTSTTAAAGDHTHDIGLGSTTDTASAIALASATKYKLTAGGNVVYFTMPTIPTVPSNIVNTITTTAGAHTAISSKTGAVSFNIPTKTSHLTNDSGFITASHTSTYSLPLAASGTRGGVQIGYSESGTNYAVKLSSEKMYVTVPWTDTKVTTTLATGDGSYYLAASSSSSGATEGLYKHSNFYAYIHGSTVTNGDVELRMGNSTASGTAGAKQGKIRLYTSGTGYIELETEATTSSANRTIKFPNASGTVALTTDIPSVPTKVSQLTNDSGYLTGITSSQVTTALGYTPYNSTNPNGYTTNTGTVTKVTAGTGLSIGTTAGGNFTTTGTINHTNSVTAQTTQAIYPIKIDAQGHISAYGSAVTPLTASSTLDATKLSGTIPAACYTNTTYGIATNTTSGLVKPWYTHTAASTGPTTGNNTTAVAVNTITTTASRYYAVEADNAGRLFVNVPWSDNNTNYYHTTGSWSGLTYTATANGGAEALAFTIPTGTSATTVAVGNHTHSYAASASAGGSATYAATTADTTNALYPVGVTSAAITTLKRDTSITFTGGTISCSGLTVASVSHTITSSEYTTIANALDALA